MNNVSSKKEKELEVLQLSTLKSIRRYLRIMLGFMILGTVFFILATAVLVAGQAKIHLKINALDVRFSESFMSRKDIPSPPTTVIVPSTEAAAELTTTIRAIEQDTETKIEIKVPSTEEKGN